MNTPQDPRQSYLKPTKLKKLQNSSQPQPDQEILEIMSTSKSKLTTGLMKTGNFYINIIEKIKFLLLGSLALNFHKTHSM